MSNPKCPVPQDLADYALGRLPEAAAQTIAQHVEQCEPCEATVSRLEVEGDTLFRRLRAAGAPLPYAEEPQCRQLIEKLASEPAPSVLQPAPVPPIPNPQSPIPSLGRIREYRLLEKLGQGGMGVVYKARHAKLDKLVALKLLSAKVTGDPESVARFEQEMRAVGKVEHPHVVRAMDAGQVKGRHYLVMEYVEGINLSDLVRTLGPLWIADACELVRQAALGLQAIDSHGLVHRDIKPSNLILNADGQVKILDLGLAVFATGAAEGESRPVMGTPDYMAPEQAQGRGEIDIRADLYSLGCTFYKLLTGNAPFSGPKYPTLLSRITAHINEPVLPLTSLRADVPPKLAVLVERLLAKDPALRVPDAGQVAEALKPFCGGADLAGLYTEAAAAARPATQPATSQAISQSCLSPAVVVAATPPAAPFAAEENFDPYYEWLGIPPGPRPPDHYRLLGLDRFEAKREVIESAVARQSAYVRTKQLGQHLALSQRLLNEISAAKVCLLIPEKKAAYDAELRKKLKKVTGDRGQVAGGREVREQGTEAAVRPPLPRADGRMGEGRGEGTLQDGSIAPPIPDPQPPIPPRWLMRALIAAGASAATLLAVVISLRTSYGTVKIELSDPQASVEVRIDGETIDLAGLEKPLQVRAGAHGLTVTSGEFQTVTESFTINRGQTQVVRVKLERKTAGQQAATSPPLPNSVVASREGRSEATRESREPKPAGAAAPAASPASISSSPVPGGGQSSKPDSLPTLPPITGTPATPPSANAGGTDSAAIRAPSQPPTLPSQAGNTQSSVSKEPPQNESSKPPVVIGTEPKNGENGVNPGLTEVKVTFSKPMRDGSWSWCSTDVAEYPKRKGDAHYLPDGRTCVMAFQLEPDTTYAISFNTEEFGNFRDENGLSAVPYVLTFSTKGASGKELARHPKKVLRTEGRGGIGSRAVVVTTEPQNGDRTVAPGLREVKVTFSTRMRDGSWSWCGTTVGEYPRSEGEPHYLPDRRTCVMAFRLEPGKTYGISFNTKTYGNFRDESGRSAVPYLLTFSTTGGSDQHVAPRPNGFLERPIEREVAGRPVVVATEPKNGDLAVNPELSEIKVTFSTAMKDSSWSWCRAPSGKFPQGAGQPHYLSGGQTCVLPVKLERATSYGIYINTEVYGNFRDENGRSAVPYLLTFSTTSGTVRGAPEENVPSPHAPSGSLQGDQKEIAVDLGSRVKLELVLIPAGTFMMGSSESPEQLAKVYHIDARRLASEQPQHAVRITKPFYLGKYPVTQEQWNVVMGNNPSQTRGQRNPVEMVSWTNGQLFLNRLNSPLFRFRMYMSGGRFGLPTEAQWEYACRAGSTTRYCFGDDAGQLGDYAWYMFNSNFKTHPVGEKKPNAWGLYDMHGNVWEWCADWHDSDYYRSSPIDDPSGPSEGSERVFRGAAFRDSPFFCRSAWRFGREPGFRSPHLGFRVVRLVEEEVGK